MKIKSIPSLCANHKNEIHSIYVFQLYILRLKAILVNEQKAGVIYPLF